MRAQIHARSNEYPTGTLPIREGPGPRAARIQRTRHVDTRVDIHTTRALRARQTTLRCIQRRGRITPSWPDAGSAPAIQRDES